LAIIIYTPIKKSIESFERFGSSPRQADGGRDNFSLFDGNGWDDLGCAGVEAFGKGEFFGYCLKFGGECEEVAKAVANTARVSEVECVLDLSVYRVTSAGDDFRVVGSGDGDFVGVGGIEAEAAVGLEVATSNLARVENGGYFRDVDWECEDERIGTGLRDRRAGVEFW